MKLDISRVLKIENTSLNFSYQHDMSDAELFGEYPYKTPLDVSGTVSNLAGMVELKVCVKGLLETQCARCLKEIKVYVDLCFENYLVTEVSNPDADNEKYLIIESEILELDDVVESAVILNTPQRQLCKEDCKGLCPVCGKDKNEGDCGCSEKTVDPRLAVLKQLLDK